MLEKPALDDEKLIDCLENNYAIHVDMIEFLPLGYDPSAAVYRVQASDSTQYFLKLKTGDLYEASLAIPVYLHQHIPEIVAPVMSISNTYWQSLEDSHFSLFPFIEGDNGMIIGLSESQWSHFGHVLKQIHDTVLTNALLEIIHRETFSFPTKWIRTIETIHADVLNTHYDNPYQHELAQFWQSRHEEIGNILRRALEISAIMQWRGFDFVLCHSDIHTANLMIDRHGQLHIVDWDHPILAPKERDLMFLLPHPMEAKSETQNIFSLGYGNPKIDPYALTYYRYEWIIQEIAEFAELMFLSDDVTDTTRADVLVEFKQLFNKGDVIVAAYTANRYLD